MKPSVSAASSSASGAAPKAILLSVGCDRYSSVTRLRSAEADAKRIYGHLTAGAAAMYGAEASTLLLSPNKLKIDNCFADLLKAHKGPDVFALYFAGHGTVVDGSFYLCPSNVSIDAVSVTAINIATVLRAICELRPRHAYVIVDACFSGGMALDLSTVLRGEVLAQSPEFGLSVLAASRLALETSESGLFTELFAKVLDGELVVRRDAPYLELGEIMRALPIAARPQLREQLPNFWELNLTGPDAFCRNPAYDAATLKSDTAFGSIRASGGASRMAPELATRLWQAYLDMPEFDREKLATLFAELAAIPGASLSPALEAIAGNFIDRTWEHDDLFATLELRSAVIQALLPQVDKQMGAREALQSQIAKFLSELEDGLRQLGDALDRDRYTLLSRPGGPADLYYLPLRLAEVLGTIGLVLLMRDVAPEDTGWLHAITKKLLTLYGESIVAVGEDQAPGLFLFFAGCKKATWVDEAEEVAGHLYRDISDHFGRVLINDPEPTDVIDYLELRRENPIEKDAPFLQKPSELLSVILLGAAAFELDEAIDEGLIELDHQGFAFFVPSTYQSFYQTRMEDGLSIVFRVGQNVWSLKDMRRIWREDVLPHVAQAMPSNDRALQNAAMILSFFLPDRLALAALPEFTRADSQTFWVQDPSVAGTTDYEAKAAVKYHK